MNDIKILLVALLGCFAAACGSDDNTVDQGPANPLTVKKATCGAGDKVETGFQGQVPAALRTVGGFKGFNCNLELVGQSRNDGASWQAAHFKNCMYYDTASATANRTQQGVVVVDMTNPAAPRVTMSLNTIAMYDPWESLKVNESRQLLGGVNALNGNGGPEIDLYDLSADCARPQLLASHAVGLDTSNDPVKAAVRGHEGNFTLDGLTYYGSSLQGRYVYAIDITNTTTPKMISKWDNSIPVDPRGIHGFVLSDDGNRLYAASFGQGGAAAGRIQQNNGLIILDTSEVQARKPNAQMKIVSTFFWDDGGGAQHSIPVKIGGKPFLIFVDEAGSGGNSTAGYEASCAAKLPAWPMARILDISDEKNPTLASRLALEIHDPANCEKITPDLAGLTSFTYGSHYCTVDDKDNAQLLVCGYFESGIRAFDIRDPLRPKEIAYFNPPSVTTPSPGSQQVNSRTAATGRADHCSANSWIDKVKGELWTTCWDNGLLALKFTNGVYPFK
jgi:hypothetical protein